MDFTIAEELTSVQQLAQQILNDFSEVEQLKAFDGEHVRFDQKLWSALAEAGLLGLDIAEAQGGTDLGFYALTTLCEEVGRTAAAAPVVPVLVSAAGTLRRFASDAQQEQWLTAIASGSLVTAALEEYGNDNPAAPAATATATATDGGYAISGTKICASVAEQAQRILLSAKCDEQLIVALVDPKAAGVTLTPQLVTANELRHEITLENVQVPAEEIIASGAAAIDAMNWATQATRTALCATMVGLCDKMMRTTGSYTTEREQFGRAIATFQAVSHRVADCYIDVECLRLVTQQAAALIDQGRPASEAVTIAKIWCGDAAHRVSQASQHCHGGTGVDRDYPLFRYCLQARQIELSMGNSAQLTGQLGEEIAREFLAAS